MMENKMEAAYSGFRVQALGYKYGRTVGVSGPRQGSVFSRTRAFVKDTCPQTERRTLQSLSYRLLQTQRVQACQRVQVPDKRSKYLIIGSLSRGYGGMLGLGFKVQIPNK